MACCTSPPRVYPCEPPEFSKPDAYLGPSGVSCSFRNKEGNRLTTYLWPHTQGQPEQARAILVLLHGNSTHATFDFLKFQGIGNPSTYEGSWVQHLNREGYSVCALDHQGHGRSEGVRAFTRHFDDRVDDALQFLGLVRQWKLSGFPSASPMYLCGYSLGGQIATRLVLRQPEVCAGLILLAPMLSLERRERETTSVRWVLKTLSLVAPQLRVGASSSEYPIPWIVDAWEGDPLIWNGGMRARNAEEYFRACSDTMQRLEAVMLPLLIFQGLKDTLVDPAGAQMLYQRAKATDKALHTLENTWHLVTKEEGQEAVLEELVQWLDQRCKPQKAAPAPTPQGQSGLQRAVAEAPVAQAPKPQEQASNSRQASERVSTRHIAMSDDADQPSTSGPCGDVWLPGSAGVPVQRTLESRIRDHLAEPLQSVPEPSSEPTAPELRPVRPPSEKKDADSAQLQQVPQARAALPVGVGPTASVTSRLPPIKMVSVQA